MNAKTLLSEILKMHPDQEIRLLLNGPVPRSVSIRGVMMQDVGLPCAFLVEGDDTVAAYNMQEVFGEDNEGIKTYG